MGVTARTASRRADILFAARSLMALHGHRATTTRKIAQRVGVSVPLIYKHFRTKKELLAEACQPDLISIHDALATASLDADAHTMEPVGTALRIILEFAMEHADSFRALFPGGWRCAQKERDEACEATPFEQLAGAARRVHPTIPEARVLEFTSAAWVLAHGIAEISTQTRGQKPAAAERDALIRLLLSGCEAKSAFGA